MGHILLKFTLDQIKPLNLIPSLQERQRIVKQVKQPTKPQRETFCKTGAPDSSNSAIFKKAGTVLQSSTFSKRQGLCSITVKSST